jgi:hypothetical protein
MASQLSGEPLGRPDQVRPDRGQILIVIRKYSLSGAWDSFFGATGHNKAMSLTFYHLDDFVARSPDELSLAKGDRVELVERDDDFGDGWYLGRHLTNGASGLFPEGQWFPIHIPPVL